MMMKIGEYVYLHILEQRVIKLSSILTDNYLVFYKTHKFDGILAEQKFTYRCPRFFQ